MLNVVLYVFLKWRSLPPVVFLRSKNIFNLHDIGIAPALISSVDLNKDGALVKMQQNFIFFKYLKFIYGYPILIHKINKHFVLCDSLVQSLGWLHFQSLIHSLYCRSYCFFWLYSMPAWIICCSNRSSKFMIDALGQSAKDSWD